MGKSSSKAESTMKTVSNIMVDVSSKVSASCSANNAINQSISQTAGGDAWMEGVSQSSDAVINLNCTISSKMENDFKQQVAEKMQSDLEAKLTGMTIGKADAETKSNIESVINSTTKISMEDIKNCLASSTTNQSISQTAGGNAVMKGISQSAAAEVVAKCDFSSSGLNKAATELDRVLAAKGSSSLTGLDPFAFLTAFIQTYGMIVGGVFLVCIVCMIGCSLVMMGGSSSPPPPPPVYR